ncbi:MAG: hypothetical protein NC548_28605 [Lachnospiraceae bacterium]|nr:hypothetical protein [Lachnospiraceae bacterium]
MDITQNMYLDMLNCVIPATALYESDKDKYAAQINLMLCAACVHYMRWSLSKLGIIAGAMPIDYYYDFIDNFPFMSNLEEKICDPWFMENAYKFTEQVCDNHCDLTLTAPMLKCVQNAMGMKDVDKATHWFGIINKSGDIKAFALDGFN